MLWGNLEKGKNKTPQKTTEKTPNSVRVGTYKIKLTLFIDGMVPTVTKRINVPESWVKLPDARLIYENQ